MSLACSSLVVLLLLLPGVLFFVGLYMPEQFTREAAERSPLGQLAAVLLVSFVVQSGLYLSLRQICQLGSWIPCFDLAEAVGMLAAPTSNSTSSALLGRTLVEFTWWIFSYVIVSAAAGGFLGYLTGARVV